ncbi:MAG TPA: polymer-forming cytoskeletal protein, partial [Ktedonobacterales bacterium]|nr:polymer-forming cytoskeletal protein [Ktedonobacterales bacterium]
MRAARTHPRARYAVLLAAFLGGIAVFGIIFAPSWNQIAQTQPANNLRMASGGLPADAAPSWRGIQAERCTPGNQDVFGKDTIVDTQQWYCDHITAYGGDITVLGRVSSDVVAVGGNIAISGEVDGRVLALGGNVTLLPGAHIGGDVQAIGGTVSRSPGVVVGGQIDRG